MERRLRNNGEAMRKKAQSAGRPSEERSDERLDRFVCARHGHDLMGCKSPVHFPGR